MILFYITPKMQKTRFYGGFLGITLMLVRTLYLCNKKLDPLKACKICNCFVVKIQKTIYLSFTADYLSVSLTNIQYFSHYYIQRYIYKLQY
jgi:hypothetical protein